MSQLELNRDHATYRPLSLAVNSGRLLGGFMIATGLIGLGSIVVSMLRRTTEVQTTNPIHAGVSAALLIVVLLVPGILLRVFAGILEARETWAAVALILLSVVNIVVGAVGAAAIAIQMSHAPSHSMTNGAGPILIASIVFTCSILLIVYCAKSIPVIQALRARDKQVIGFPPVMPEHSGKNPEPSEVMKSAVSSEAIPSRTSPGS